MCHLRLKIFFLILILLFISCNQFEPDKKEFIDILERSSLNISGLDNDSNISERLRTILRDKTIIGLGEATHGTHEFFKLRCQFSKFLISELNYKTIAIEAGFQECADLNNYISYGFGDPKKLIRGLHQWFWQREEMLVFIEWLKKFNEGKDEDEKVQIYGFDMQWRSASVKSLISFLSQTNPRFYDTQKSKLLKILDIENEALDDSIFQAIEKIENNLIDDKIKYLSKSSKEQYDMVFQNIQILKQAELFLTDRNEVKLDYEKMRNKFMAGNLIWINKLKPKNKIIIWAHNGHVSKGERCGFLNIICEKAMGNILKSKFGNKYYPIGFEFNKGSFMAFYNRKDFKPVFLNSASKNSLPYFLSKAKSDNCFIDFELLADTDQLGKKFLNSPIETHSIGTNYYKKRRYTKRKLSDHFEALIFIEHSTPLKFLK